jgi:TetR/AcrR family transcriptional regulator, tetracycline repressor protein
MSRRDEVLQAALDLLDEVGLDDLTVRRLAERLDVAPSALYRHFASKSALVDAMVEAIVSAAGAEGEPHPDVEWAVRVHTIAAGMRRMMLSRRDGARLLTTYATPGPTAIEAFERFTAVLGDAGLGVAAARRAVDTVVCYVNGFTIEEQTRRPTNPARRTSAERDEDFHAGLDLIISGVRAGILRRA